MVGCLVDVFYEVLITGVTTLCAHSATVLSAILAKRCALNVAKVRNGDNHRVVGIEILGIHFIGRVLYLRSASIAILFFNLNQFVLYHLAAHIGIVQNLLKVLYSLQQFVQFVMEFTLFQISKLTQTHLHYGPGLHIIQVKSLHQALTGLLSSLATTDNAHHLVDVVRGHDQAFDNMSTLLGFLKLKFRATYHHVVTVVEEVLYKLF